MELECGPRQVPLHRVIIMGGGKGKGEGALGMLAVQVCRSNLIMEGKY